MVCILSFQKASNPLLTNFKQLHITLVDGGDVLAGHLGWYRC